MIDTILNIIFVGAIAFFSFSMGMLYEHYLNERSAFRIKSVEESK